eukprot:CAMPEP_0174856566 /NCGR_PEP_ID=MMETSP1114-20130205/36105_1 /TAXON_ID=312471 /ORGANISM="Neobodo designis, Strain CCAP 1951/1" /LENGTH=77 /DNA_ID=CAMNT_0016091367 /DNA_START=44 /DNA_END=273 /DNA_ORIENTATION=+
MKLRLVVSLFAVALASVLGTACASVSGGAAPHVAWRVTGPSITDTYNSGVAYGGGNVFIGYCVGSGVGFAAYDAATG